MRINDLFILINYFFKLIFNFFMALGRKGILSVC